MASGNNITNLAHRFDKVLSLPGNIGKGADIMAATSLLHQRAQEILNSKPNWKSYANGLIINPEILMEEKTRVDIFREFAHRRKESTWTPFFKLLNKDDPFTQNMTARIIAKIACWSDELMEGSDLNYFLCWLRDNLNFKDNDYLQNIARCLQMMLRIEEYRTTFVAIDGVKHIVQVLSNKTNFQVQYQLTFCLWIITFNVNLIEKLTKYNIIPILADILAETVKEKVTRIILATFRNLTEKPEDKEIVRDNAITMLIDYLQSTSEYNKINELKEMTTINDIPIEILPFVFKHLGIKDIVRVRLVCKLWKHLADKQKINDLVILPIYRTSSPEFVNKWFYSDDKIDEDDILRMNPFDKDYDLFKYKIPKIDQFPTLEQLDCEIAVARSEPKIIICHDNLKVLYINRWGPFGFLELDTPSLECLHHLGSVHNDDIRIYHPEMLKFLCAPLFWDLMDMSDFKNLEYISGAWSLNFDGNLLNVLPKLTEIRFNFDNDQWSEFYEDGYENAYSLFLNSMIDLIKTKHKLNRNYLKIYLDDTELISEDQFKGLFLDYEFEFINRYGPEESDVLSDD